VALRRIDHHIAVAVPLVRRLEPHLLVPAVHPRDGVRLDGKREVLVDPGVAPPDPGRVGVVGLERPGPSSAAEASPSRVRRRARDQRPPPPPGGASAHGASRPRPGAIPSVTQTWLTKCRCGRDPPRSPVARWRRHRDFNQELRCEIRSGFRVRCAVDQVEDVCGRRSSRPGSSRASGGRGRARSRASPPLPPTASVRE
jgi:hypothetical protein